MSGIDLHTHSTRSDGTDTPTQLVTKAAAPPASLATVAITDHDTTAGWAEAMSAAQDNNIEVVRGIELTTKNQGQTQHLLAYEPDPTEPELIAMLAKTVRSREERILQMVEIINKREPTLTMSAVREQCREATIGRPHIADAMIAKGIVSDRGEAFRRFLSPECSTYVPRWSPDIEDAIRVVALAGGVTVIAHPRGKKSTVSGGRIAELQRVGLAGIEVEHQEHSESDRAELRQIAQDLDLVATESSDYHGTGKVDHELGCNTTPPDQYERLQELMARASADRARVSREQGR